MLIFFQGGLFCFLESECNILMQGNITPSLAVHRIRDQRFKKKKQSTDVVCMNNIHMPTCLFPP